ncbi:uncharacterized protein N0V89_010585 [Didymosphaeria variabile]|uniref:NAD(P)-binding domain-containing protein n=1 Tax=Didymosphaeria variabile TaxID=1932322 RepID=A0A9W9C6B5_9PLEO|nr:uncharacterized protein N0V89_010585 [Didymosphaeria variabile]KAJ4346654.1 hypothetical protein N0V89_010585 [Didymosphaeria variabile]
MAPTNILVTGAAGYIGGSIVADFLTGVVPSLEKGNIIAAVRSEEQAAALSDSGVNVTRLDLTDGEAVAKTIVDHDSTLRGTGNEIFAIEKQLADSYPVRKTDVTVIEQAQSQGVISFIVIPCLTHGKGTGAWNKLSVNIPIVINASIKRKEVRRFADNIKVSYVHISDLTALYGRIVEKILQGEEPPSGSEGYYFSTSYQISSHHFADQLAAALHARGLVSSPKPEVWPSAEAAAEALGVPAKFVEYLWNSGCVIHSPQLSQANSIRDDAPSTGIGSGPKIGWKPKWDEEKFFRHIDDEVDAVLELGKAKSSLVDSLFAAAKE